MGTPREYHRKLESLGASNLLFWIYKSRTGNTGVLTPGTDMIDECYNRKERMKQQELFEAQYNVSQHIYV